jgi:PAS domain S-box-containing protein
MSTLPPFLDRFLTPSAAVPKESSGWYRARLTMAVSALVLAFYFIPELILHLIVPQDQVNWRETSIILGGFALVALGFLFARTPHYHWGIWLILGGWTFDILLDIATGEGFELGATIEVWLMFGLVMAFLLLDLRAYILFAIVQAAATAAVVLWRHFTVASFNFSVELHLAVTALLGLGIWLRERDQRQREQAQAELQAQKDYLQKVIDGVQSPFYVVDVHDYRIRLANRAARDLGLVEERVTCYALTHHRSEPCGGDEHPCPLQHVRVSREPYTTEHIHFRPDGSTYYAEVRGYPLFDAQGNVVQMVEYSVDITERKLAEAEIRKLQQAVEHAASGVAITNANGVFEYVNPTFERMTGYSRQEVVGQTPRLLKSGYHSTEFYAELWKTIKSGQVWQGETVNRRKDGSLYWELQTIAPVQVNGKISHFVAVKLDITAQKELEKQLREAKETAEQANAFKSRLLAGVSHDMRTPLGGIIGYAELLKSGAFGEMNEKQQDILQKMTDSASRLNDFIRGMLTRAELESGKLRLQPRSFPPTELFKALTSHENAARRKGLTFHTECDPALPPTLHADPYWLEQILINLVDNAIKYTERGSVSARLRRVDERHWAMEVQDTGMGIPAELHERIFEEFEQAEEVKRIQGVGLGLSIVKELVKRLGGEIHLQSAPGEGSTFTVIFAIEEIHHEA